MSLKRLVLGVTFVMLCLGWSVSATAQTAQYKLSGDGSGGQLQIGGGLPLPIQIQQFTTGTAMNPTNLGTNFPPLLVPKKAGPVTITGTTAMTVQQKLSIPQSALSKIAQQKTLGQFGQNPSLYAVATNLNWVWPAAPAVLSTGARTGLKTTTFTPTATATNPEKIKYSNPLAAKFGGPAQFLINPVLGQGFMPNVAVTIYGIAVPGPGNPPCTHTALGGANNACVAAIAQALPSGVAAVGGPVSTFVSTPGGTPTVVAAGGPNPGAGLVKVTSNGFPQIFVPIAATGFTNMASSFGFPWTTGMLTIIQPNALGAAETFTITGMDNRGANGAGTIQLVSGALSQRTLSGPNANRGWIRLKLVSLPVATPAVPPAALVAGAGLMLLAAGYAVRRFTA